MSALRLRLAAWAVIAKHLKGKHDQLAHGQRYKTENGKRVRVETRAEGRRKRLAEVREDYEQARDRVRARSAAAHQAQGEVSAAAGLLSGPDELKSGVEVRSSTGALWRTTRASLPKMSRSGYPMPGQFSTNLEPASRQARGEQERSKRDLARATADDSSARRDALKAERAKRAERAATQRKQESAPKGTSRRRSSTRGRATDRQVDYAMSLIRQNWHDSDDGQAFRAPTRAEVSRMSAREVSGLIEDMLGPSGGGRSQPRLPTGGAPLLIQQPRRRRRR